MIDAHVHLWQRGRLGGRWPGPELPALYRDFGLGELAVAVRGTGVARAVLVQSQPDEADTRWLLGLAAAPGIAGVVGWIDLEAADVDVRLEALAALGPLVGIRPMVQDLADDWYDKAVLAAGMAALARRGLVLDALVRVRHLPSLARLAARHPALAIVIDHAAKPAIGGEMDGWAAAMRTLAAHPRVACKLSGLVTEIVDDRPDAAVRPFLEESMAIFGPDRLIWGSDWPVLSLRTSYAAWLDLARGAVAPRHRAAVFGGNAARLYPLRAAA